MTAERAGQARRFPWTGCLLVAGLLLRCYHYFRDPAVWHDEAALILNVLGKSFAEMLGPLFCSEAAPPLFLWVEKAVVLLLGDDSLVLRLVPFLASCGSLLLLAWLARRILRPEAVPWAVLLAAFSDRLLWHACEAKPYALDVFAAVGLPALFWATRDWLLPRRLLLFTVVAPVAICLSFPGCFLLGGVLVAFLPDVWRDRNFRSRAAYIGLAAAVFGSFLFLSLGPIRAQHCGDLESCWVKCFPDWHRPWLFPWWSLKRTVEVVDYCFRPLGGALLLLALAGVLLLWRQGQRGLLALLLLPIGLAWVAGCLHAYPYTGARVMAFALPALALLIAAAVPAAFQLRHGRTFPVVVALLVFLLAPAGLSLYRLVVPEVRPDWQAATDYVLRHYRPGDRVLSNAWEPAYYFRALGPAYQSGLDLGAEPGERVWVLVSSASAQYREILVEQLVGQDRQLLQRESFELATVCCMGQTEAVANRRTPVPNEVPAE